MPHFTRLCPRCVLRVVAFVLVACAGCGPSKDRAVVDPSPSPQTKSTSVMDSDPTLDSMPVIDSTPTKKDSDIAVQSTVSLAEPATEKPAEWTSLFDGESLGNWMSTQFGGEGEVSVEDGMIILPMGDDMTGVTWRGQPPARMDYELEVEARRVEGGDFFCGLTFPVGKDYCSLICGGWGGEVTGLSSLDGNDANHNETSQRINYEKGRWYHIRLRVTEHRIAAWLDDKSIVDTDTTNRRIGIRGEVDPSKPLGIATWRTTGAIRSIRLRKLHDEESTQR